MKRIILAALAAFVVLAPLYAETEIGYRDDAGYRTRFVASSTPLPVDPLPGSISSLPVNIVSGIAVSSSFITEAGVATAAVVDSGGRVKVNLSSTTVTLTTTPSFVDSGGTASSAALTAAGKIPVDVTSPFVRATTGVATSAVTDSDGALHVNITSPGGTTATVDIGNTLSVGTGIMLQSISSVGSTLIKAEDICSGTAAPFWLNLAVGGTASIVRMTRSGSTATDSCTPMQAGDFLNLYVSTNTPNIGVVIPSTVSAATVTWEIWK